MILFILNRNELHSHVGWEHSQVIYWYCKKCHKEFDSVYNLLAHIRSNHIEGVFMCSHNGCYYIGTTQNQVAIHIRKTHLSEELDQMLKWYLIAATPKDIEVYRSQQQGDKASPV